MEQSTPVTLDHAPEAARSARARLPLFVTLLVLINLVWAAQPLAVKYLEKPLSNPENGNQIATALLPFLVATPLMAPFLFVARSTPRVRPGLKDWGRFAIAGIGGQIVCQVGMTWGMAIGLASNCAILYLLIPVITAVMATIMLGERLTALRVICLFVGLIGVMIMSVQELRNSAFLESKYLAGNALMLLGCLGACFYNVYCKGLMRRFDERDILIYSYIVATIAGTLLLAFIDRGSFARLLKLDTQATVALGFNALLVYGLSMVVFFYVLQHLPVTVALTSTYMVPVFGVVLAMVVLGERLSVTSAIGSLIVLASTVLIMKYDAPAAVE
jgi:drug/metabolite transporter (DMT)-like permease